ncbi:xanthine dehydrogenase YagR molybdenum-binding subunit [Saccharopolyspora lacisalsi]|uniref:Xanthine dehydrogenase YagR molybdenum-binding subunit n=1 Tax=Halosaccharopolyspora lacisalsi TaxID=1000566 RepID=A0A839E1G0_9PSEU|nr:xanthine dehydrogenase family protein molybdopterin-binding subunit [Halosaccharopolyspora lacisalsi]MBA8824798.1 xanthine dehydrogenase YagR molybdenum-binding subunit [Halosaccharopolyspora lacisalsi]
MTSQVTPYAIGTALQRLDGRSKVTGTAPYAFERVVDNATYLHPVQATIALGQITAIDTAEAEALDGVITILTHVNAPRLASTEDRELAVLQTDRVSFRGQLIGAVIADTPETARQAAGLVRISYAQWPHEAELSSERSDLYTPEAVNPSFPADTDEGDVDTAMSAAPVTLDTTYTTPLEYNNPMEPHTTVALWNDHELTLYDSTQGAHTVRTTVAPVIGLDPERIHVSAPHVGGGFGSKGIPHAHIVLAALAARTVEGRPVKFALTRQQMFSLAGHRTPTIQRVRLAADTDGRLSALAHDVVEWTSKVKEFAEQTAVPSRNVYAAPNRRTSHRLAALDVPVPSWMRAPGECPGMFGPEVAVDEMALKCGIDPVEFRARNEPDVDPETGKPFSSRHLVECLREGADRFGWHHRDPTPASRTERGWLVGTGVASSIYPTLRAVSTATIRVEAADHYRVDIGATDIGTGTWTALTQIAADALEVPVGHVDLRIGETAQPEASVAGGSTGNATWGTAIVEAARALQDTHGRPPEIGAEASGTTPNNPETERFAMFAHGAQFAEVRVHADTGEIRVPRMLGVFAAGRIINPRTAHSQFIGGMTMGLSMALHEVGVLDTRFGHVVNHDFAEYHIPTNADVGDIDATWIDEDDPYVNPMGAKGIGEIGIVGAAAAIANAAHHATGIRLRELPITPDALLR